MPFRRGSRWDNRTAMTALDYLSSIDWVGAAVVGTICVVVGLVLLRFMMASSSEIGSMIPGASQSAARAVLDARDLPVDSWVCAVCRSVNRPTAGHCYRGCGERDEVARPMPIDPDLLGTGVNGRRS